MIPLSISKEEVYEVIGGVARNHRNKAFGIYTPEDIEQEVWIIALSKLDDFAVKRGTVTDPKKALEHWLNRVIANALSNLKRDKFINPAGRAPGPNLQKKLNLLFPLPLTESIQLSGTQIAEAQLSEYWDLILKSIDDHMFHVLESILSGEKVSLYYRLQLCKYIAKTCQIKNVRPNR